jgi:hypothetical protein
MLLFLKIPQRIRMPSHNVYSTNDALSSGSVKTRGEKQRTKMVLTDDLYSKNKFEIQNSRFKIRDSKFEIQDSRFKIQSLRKEIGNWKLEMGNKK